MQRLIDPNSTKSDALARLIASVPKEYFGSEALEFLSQVARIENFGAYHISDLASPVPSLSFWSGRISDYWFQRDADLILGDEDTQEHILAMVQAAPDGGVSIDRWHPPQNSPRSIIYRRNGVIERIAVSSGDGRSGVRSFYLRSLEDGWLDDHEYDALCSVLPIVHELVCLRHQIVGIAKYRVVDGARATKLRDTNVGGFGSLTPREAEVCDLLLDGRSIAASALDLGVTEATIRTLRQRAFRKLYVSSARELMAMVLKTAS